MASAIGAFRASASAVAAEKEMAFWTADAWVRVEVDGVGPARARTTGRGADGQRAHRATLSEGDVEHLLLDCSSLNDSMNLRERPVTATDTSATRA
jgi:hypothetical protein